MRDWQVVECCVLYLVAINIQYRPGVPVSTFAVPLTMTLSVTPIDFGIELEPGDRVRGVDECLLRQR